MADDTFNPPPSPKNAVRLPKPGTGRPRIPRISEYDISRLDAEGIIEKLFQTLSFEVIRLRRDAGRRGALTPEDAKRVQAMARAVETCAQAKRHIIEAARAEDLSNIPTEQLVRVVVGQMRKLPELAAAVTAEIGRRKPVAEAPPA